MNISYYTGKSYYNWGLNYNAHIETYWVATGKVKVFPDYDAPADSRYVAVLGDYDLDCKVGIGKTKEEAIEELFIAMDN